MGIIIRRIITDMMNSKMQGSKVKINLRVVIKIWVTHLKTSMRKLMFSWIQAELQIISVIEVTMTRIVCHCRGQIKGIR